jgi:hypothetical protein
MQRVPLLGVGFMVTHAGLPAPAFLHAAAAQVLAQQPGASLGRACSLSSSRRWAPGQEEPTPLGLGLAILADDTRRRHGSPRGKAR